MVVTIYHNPRCSKSRQTLALLEAGNIELKIVEYLKNPPDSKTLKAILDALDAGIDALIRSGEYEYKESAKELKDMDENQILGWLAAHPKVLQRPIVVTHRGARIGRPPERVLEVLN